MQQMTLFNNIEIIIATVEVIEKPTGNGNYYHENSIFNGLMCGRPCKYTGNSLNKVVKIYLKQLCYEWTFYLYEIILNVFKSLLKRITILCKLYNVKIY